jgi:thiol-disulfide isomerase/thioredoxin
MDKESGNSVTPQNIDGFLKSRDKVIVLFYADWCPFCRAFFKMLGSTKVKLSNELAFANISDESNPFWLTYKVERTPVLIAFSKGVAVARKDPMLNMTLSEQDLVDLDSALSKA